MSDVLDQARQDNDTDLTVDEVAEGRAVGNETTALLQAVNQTVSVLFVHYGDEWLRGSERCLLDLMTHIDRSRYQPVVWCNSTAFAEAATALDIPVHQSAFPLLLGWHSPKLDVGAWRGLIHQGEALVKQYDVQIIHANSGAPCQWLNSVARRSRVALVAHLHSRYPARDRITLGLHHTPCSVGVSQPVVQQLLDDGVPASAVTVIPNGLDTKRLDAAPTQNLREAINAGTDTFVLVTTGSLIHRKGVDLLIQSVAQLREQQIDVALAIIGAGDAEDSLTTQTQQAGLNPYVHFLGEQNGVCGWLRGGADLYVSGAREEVFGLALAEASLSGLAVVAPKVGGIASVISQGETGLLVEPENSKAITGAILDLYRNGNKRQQMGTAGRQRVLNHFTIEQNVKRFEHLYREQIDNANARITQQPRQQPRWRFGISLSVMAKTMVNTLMRKVLRLLGKTPGAAQTGQHILILDPTAFAGGSKIATERLLHPLVEPEPRSGHTDDAGNSHHYRITVLTSDPQSWRALADRTVGLFLPNWLAKQQQGLAFFALNGWIALQVLLARLRSGKVHIAIGASGPGVDLSLYLARVVTNYRILQLVHGPVATSRTIGRCLDQADQVQYLDTTKDSLLAALDRHRPGRSKQLPETCHPFHNTLPANHWPSPCQYDQPTLLWAASLLSWKGLPTLLKALEAIPAEQRLPSNICYIRPVQTDLPISDAPVALSQVSWHEQPDNLDAIRAASNIFVSTSHQEPFGLSILEAMAAGHCVLIPEDGAYWDKRLIHNRECIKYPPDDHQALSQILLELTANPTRIKELGQEAANHAQAYRNDKQPDSLHHFFSLHSEGH